MTPMKRLDIAPITELKRDAASLIERPSEQRSLIVITQNGRATADVLRNSGVTEHVTIEVTPPSPRPFDSHSSAPA